ncbi:MAG TPA: hypothetical protein VFO60_02710 [Candidatus Dormibacteraeota bacterium]|nr:hypothetical protein [Candidatus Dormibacteraeota bacterium]
MAEDAERLRRRIEATREAMLAGVPHDTIRTLVADGRLDELRDESARRAAARDAGWLGWAAARETCPSCGGVGVHLLYGMPGPHGAAAARSGDVALGGPAPTDPALWRCGRCGSQWGRAQDDPVPLRPPS